MATQPRIVFEGGAAVPLALWQAASSNEATVNGRLLLGGKPVVGARMGLDRYTSTQSTNADGGFSLRVDKTLPQRHPVRVAVSPARGSEAAHRQTPNRARCVREARASPSRTVSSTSARACRRTAPSLSAGGPFAPTAPRCHGSCCSATGSPAQSPTPRVVLCRERRSSPRTTDRDFWTFSAASNSTGRYVSFFSASDEQGSDPVQLNVQVAVGQRSYSAGLANVDFKRLE